MKTIVTPTPDTTTIAAEANALTDLAADSAQHAIRSAQSAARRGVEALRETSVHLRERALKATDSTAGYIKEDPLKSVLIAAAAGAALMALLGLLGRSRRSD